jgi:hypothetical protein
LWSGVRATILPMLCIQRCNMVLPFCHLAF